MQREEVTAVGELAGDAVAALVTQAEAVHRSIASRVWTGAGPMSVPVRLVHDGIARAAYATARLSLRSCTRGAAVVLGGTLRVDGPTVQRSAAARRAVAALNGAIGDRLERRRSPLAVAMAIRADGEAVAATPGELARAFPRATAKLAVFLHGLGQSEASWQPGSEASHGERLRAELGYTPVYVGYNSGRAVVQNGEELARVLEQTVESWPVRVEEVALIGYSIGGLVARSACHHGAGRPWIGTVRHLFTLATPHEGAAVERLAGALATVLARLPESRPLAEAIELRSAGVRDFGRGSELPFAPGVNHYFISAGATLVGRASAWAQRERHRQVDFPVDHYRHIDAVSDPSLLTHPAVYALISRWLARPAPGGPPRALAAGGANGGGGRGLGGV